MRRPTYKASDRNDVPHRAYRDDVMAHLKKQGQLVDVRSPEEYAGTRMHMPDYPNEGALRGGHIPTAKSVPWSKAVNPDDGTFKPAAELKKLYLRGQQARAREGNDRVLPHRRAQQPHLVRAEVPARLSERPQLRRQLDRVGQHGRRAD